MTKQYSDNMKHIIRNIGDKLPVFSGITGRSRQGTSQATLHALLKRKVIALNPRGLEIGQPTYYLTAHGMEAYKYLTRYREGINETQKI